MDKKPITRAERPRVEPEILPPGDPRTRYEGMFGGTHRIHVARIGPFRFAVLALGIALFAALVLLLVLGAFVVLLPLAGLLLAIALLTGWLRGFSRGIRKPALPVSGCSLAVLDLWIPTFAMIHPLASWPAGPDRERHLLGVPI